MSRPRGCCSARFWCPRRARSCPWMQMRSGCCPGWRSGWWCCPCGPAALCRGSRTPGPTASAAGPRPRMPGTYRWGKRPGRAQGHGGLWRASPSSLAGCSTAALSCRLSPWLSSLNWGGTWRSPRLPGARHRFAVGTSDQTTIAGPCGRGTRWRSTGCVGWCPGPIRGRHGPGTARCWWSCPGPSTWWTCLRSRRAALSCPRGTWCCTLARSVPAGPSSPCLRCRPHHPGGRGDTQEKSLAVCHGEQNVQKQRDLLGKQHLLSTWLCLSFRVTPGAHLVTAYWIKSLLKLINLLSLNSPCS